jgi:intracellular sulfur oxidation DsrE/DsrF family protein
MPERPMRRRTFVAFAATAAVSLAGLGGFASAQESAKKTRVVVQVSDADPARWNLALNNVRNLQEDLGAANVTIEIVAYGPGIGMLKLDAVSNSRITDALKAGVQVSACENTMRNQKLARADMHPGVGYVPAGVVEIIERQQQGWAYLRP